MKYFLLSMMDLIKRSMKTIHIKHVMIVVALVFSGSCFAAGEVDSEILSNIVVLMNLVLSVMLAILTPAIILLGWLLSPDWTMGDFFGLRKYFLQVWILVSNLVYIVFALMLLYMAIMQIFNGEDEFAFKQKLPKFLGGILLVPFTWLIVSWTLSFANQAVAAVLSIPMGAISSIGTTDENNPFNRRVIPREMTFSTGDNSNPENFTCEKGISGGKACMTPAEFVTNNGSGPFFIILIYAYDIFQINTADVIELNKFCDPNNSEEKDSRGCIRDLMGIVRTAGMSLIVTVFFGIMTIALCWVLLMRAIKLWIYVMFSPLFGLAYFSGKGFGEALHSEGGGGESMGFTDVGFVPFFKLAMVPVLVAAVLSFGLLFIGVMRQSFDAIHTGSSKQSVFSSGKEVCSSDQYLVRYCIQKNTKAAEGYNSKLIIGSNTKDGGAPGDYTITFNFGDTLTGFIGDADDGSATVLGTAAGAVDSVESIFAHIIITLIALAVMWTGVKAAVHHDAVTEAAFAPFAKLGESVTHMVQHAPSYLPLPHPAFAALTRDGISGIADKMRTYTDEKVEASKARSLGEILGSESISKFSNSVNDFSNATKEGREKNTAVLNSIKQGERDTSRVLTAVKKGMQDMSQANDISAEDKRIIVDINQKVQSAGSMDEVQGILSTNSDKIKTIKDQSTKNFLTAAGSDKPVSDLPGGKDVAKISGASVANNKLTFNSFEMNTTTQAIPSGKVLSSADKEHIKSAAVNIDSFNSDAQAKTFLTKLFGEDVAESTENQAKVANKLLTEARKSETK